MHCVRSRQEKIRRNITGSFYTALSRGTTPGDDEGMNSAIYFIGSQFREGRGITKLKNSAEDFVIAKKRKKWVQFLKKREHLSQKHLNAVLTDKESIISTLNSTTFDLISFMIESDHTVTFTVETIQKAKI